MIRGHTLLALALALLAGCAGSVYAPVQSAVADDPLSEAAALLVAAEGARNTAERAPMIAGLDALGVDALPDAPDNQLAQWREDASRDPAAGAVPVYRGRALGRGYRRAQLAAGQQLVIDQIFMAGERAEMAAQTRGGQPIVLQVANAQSEKVCEAQLTPHGRCRWLPIFTERFQITLENRGSTPASVYLVFD